MSDKSKPKSLRDQLAPIKDQLKTEALRAQQAEDEARRAKKEAEKQQKRQAKAPTPPPREEIRLTSQETAALSAQRPAGEMSDAEVVEFWRAAAGAVAINDRGREVHEPKKKARPGDPPPPPATATVEDQADFASWLDNFSDEQAATISYQKEGKAPPPGRAIAKDRVSLEGLAPEPARERLARFVKAARARGEGTVLVFLGRDPQVQAGARSVLSGAREVAFVEEVDAHSLRVTLNRG